MLNHNRKIWWVSNPILELNIGGQTPNEPSSSFSRLYSFLFNIFLLDLCLILFHKLRNRNSTLRDGGGIEFWDDVVIQVGVAAKGLGDACDGG